MRFTRVPRGSIRRLCPMWAVCVVAVWGAMVAAAAALGAEGTCLFRRVTGVPCLTCGSTRAVIALARGDLAGAWLLNPLVMTALAVAVAAAGMQVVAGRRLEWTLSRPERIAAWAVVAVAAAGNWVYVALVVG